MGCLQKKKEAKNKTQNKTQNKISISLEQNEKRISFKNKSFPKI